MSGLAGPDGDPDREVGLAGAGRAEEQTLARSRDEVERAEMRYRAPFERALETEVEVLQRLACREPCGADTAFTTVVLAGGDFVFEARGEELFVGPALRAGAFGEPFD